MKQWSHADAKSVPFNSEQKPRDTFLDPSKVKMLAWQQKKGIII